MLLTDIAVPFLVWLRDKTDDFANYLDEWICALCPCEDH